VRLSTKSKFYALTGAVLCGVIVFTAWWQHRPFSPFLDLVDEDTRLFLSRTLFHVGGAPVRVWFIIKTVLFLVFLSLASRAAKRIVRRLLRGNPLFDEHRGYVVSRMVSFAIYATGILIGIHVERINLSTLAFIGGI